MNTRSEEPDSRTSDVTIGHARDTGPVLGFDTSTDELAIALMDRAATSVVLRRAHDFSARRDALSRLLPAVDELLRSEGVAIRDLVGIVVGRGPGSFTGVRIAVATAKGLAHGLGVPLHGVSTLDTIARRLGDHEGLLGIVGDAMRGEVYPALFRAAEGRVGRLTPDRVSLPLTAAEEFRELGEPVLLSGNGLAKYREVFETTLGSAALVADEALWAPTGAGLADAYQAVIEAAASEAPAFDSVDSRQQARPGPGDPGTLLPIYTRLSDAEENERLRAGMSARPTPSSGVDGPAERER